MRWSRGEYQEAAAGDLLALPHPGAETIATLRTRYGVDFAARLNAKTSINNYEYLDILDSSWGSAALEPPRGGVLCDAGCASFFYAAALHAFFTPSRMIGVEIEAHRLFRDIRTRIDYAAGYVRQLPNTQFVAADYATYRLPADIITAWFPFVTPAAVLAWRMPLSLLAPRAFLAAVAANLKPGGKFFMVNHGEREADIAAAFCVATGLRSLQRSTAAGSLSTYRKEAAIASIWELAPARQFAP